MDTKKIKQLGSIVLSLLLAVNIAACGAVNGENGSDSNSGVDTGVDSGSPSASDTGLENSGTGNSSTHTHEFGGEWKIAKNGHYHQCQVDGCSDIGDYASHQGTAADCASLPVCDTCGATYGSAPGHSYTEWKIEQEEKLCYCACGEYVSIDNLVDFTVEIPDGKAPVILHLSDTQMTTSGNIDGLCYNYIRETVQATKPDLILMTGDLVYGRFDETGSMFKSLIACMESFQIPWAPVFGNHDNESLMGVNWQCQQLEAAKYCLFKQGDLAGNGNYSVGLWQNDNLTRVFYMMDSNGCSSPMIDRNGNKASQGQGDNKVHTSAGIASDQKLWYASSIATLRKACPDVKISFAYHIQNSVMNTVFNQIEGYSVATNTAGDLKNPINLGVETATADGSFGFIGRSPKGPWSGGDYLTELKNLGVDSVFMGHEHCNSASIVYQGVRFQYAQKSSQYDRYNVLLGDGSIVSSAAGKSGTPLMGGTVLTLSATDGAIQNGYLYLCGITK